MSDVERELNSVKEEVQRLLEKYPRTRDNDFYLQWLYLKGYLRRKYDIQLPMIPFEAIDEISGKLETVSRVRRQLQSSGQFLPTDPEVLRKRRLKEEEYRQHFGMMKREREWNG